MTQVLSTKAVNNSVYQGWVNWDEPSWQSVEQLWLFINPIQIVVDEFV